MQAVAPAIHLPLCSCLVPEVMVIRSCGVPGTWAKMGGFLLSPPPLPPRGANSKITHWTACDCPLPAQGSLSL